LNQHQVRKKRRRAAARIPIAPIQMGFQSLLASPVAELRGRSALYSGAKDTLATELVLLE